MIVHDLQALVSLAARARPLGARTRTDWRLMFSQVREDPRVELASMRASAGAGRVLTIASAGCTALSLLSLDEVTHVDAIDPNPLQIALCRFKQDALRALPLSVARALLGDAPADPRWRQRTGRSLGVALDPAIVGAGVLQAGQFEQLFGCFREFVQRLVCPADQLARLFDPNDSLDGRRLLARFDRKFWPLAFSLFFGDRLLETMFGDQATQYAPPGSYPHYFQRAFERALTQLPTHDNYFLSQILLGRSIGCRPPYLTCALTDRLDRLSFHQADLEQFLSRPRAPYDLVCLSNVFDWMDQPAIERVCRLLLRAVRPGSRIVLRQINNQRALPAVMRDALEPLEAEADDWLARDRSFFYSRLCLWRVR